MTQEMILNIAKVINTLNTVSVSGKQNMAALAGSIGVLEDIYTKLVSSPDDKKETDKKETEAS